MFSVVNLSKSSYVFSTTCVWLLETCDTYLTLPAASYLYSPIITVVPSGFLDVVEVRRFKLSYVLVIVMPFGYICFTILPLRSYIYVVTRPFSSVSFSRRLLLSYFTYLNF